MMNYLFQCIIQVFFVYDKLYRKNVNILLVYYFGLKYGWVFEELLQIDREVFGD